MLKTLHIHSRPFAVFDPTSTDHRRYYQQFLKTGSWQHSPYQWIIDDDCIDVVHHIDKKIVNFYLQTEFSRKRRPAKPSTQVLKIKDIKKQVRQ
jgi:hypothetical protein